MIKGALRFDDSRFSRRVEITPLQAPSPEEEAFSAPNFQSLVPTSIKAWQIDVSVGNDTTFSFSGNAASGEIIPDLRITGTVGNPIPVGKVELKNARIFFPFTTMTIPEGHIEFLEDSPWMPQLDLRGSAQALDYEVEAYAFGPLSESRLILRSDPPLPQEMLIQLLTTGMAPGVYAGAAPSEAQGGLALPSGAGGKSQRHGCQDGFESERSSALRFSRRARNAPGAIRALARPLANQRKRRLRPLQRAGLFQLALAMKIIRHLTAAGLFHAFFPVQIVTSRRWRHLFPPMKSMTGHGRGTATASGFRVVAECFSVNRRQGEVAVVAARELAWIEPRVREEVLKRISRGKVQVSISVERALRSASAFIDRRRAAEFLREARALQKELDIAGAISLETILAAPGVLRVDDAGGPELWPLIERALGAALEGLLAMRVREGAHLKKALVRDVTGMSGLVRRVRILAPRVPRRQREILLRRLQSARLPMVDSGSAHRGGGRGVCRAFRHYRGTHEAREPSFPVRRTS